MAAIVKQEWLNANAGRAYPFEENMARIPYDVTGAEMPALALPNYVVKLLRTPFSRNNFVMFGHEENEKARKNRAPNPR